MEQPFLLRVRKNRLVFALLGALWLSIGVVSALYVAHAPSVTAEGAAEGAAAEAAD